jgi:hypothetical protein
MKNQAKKIDNQQGNGVLPCVSGSTSNLGNVLCMLHEFRNWNREWDIYFAKQPKNVDEFAELLSKRYKVERV